MILQICLWAFTSKKVDLGPDLPKDLGIAKGTASRVESQKDPEKEMVVEWYLGLVARAIPHQLRCRS